MLHYECFINGKRVYEKHKTRGLNGNKPMGINISLYSLFKEKQRARSLVRLERRALNHVIIDEQSLDLVSFRKFLSRDHSVIARFEVFSSKFQYFSIS